MSISRATHSGQLAIADVMLPCFVLDEGTRVLSQEGMLRAFGRSCQAKAGIRDERHPPGFPGAKEPPALHLRATSKRQHPGALSH